MVVMVLAFWFDVADKTRNVVISMLIMFFLSGFC